MENKVIYVLLLIVMGGIASAWEIEDINGTYLYDEEHLDSPLIRERDYTWGKGRRLTETSIEFDLGKMTVLMPGLGLYNIEKVFKDNDGSVCLVLYYISDTDKNSPMNMKIVFIDSGRVLIVHDEWENYWDRRYSPEAKWVWYRLSGPS